MNWKSYFWPQIIFSTSSSLNSKIEIRELFGKLSLRVENVTQSGGIVEEIYGKILQSRIIFQKKREEVIKVLILGFGTGTFAKLIKQKYPLAKILGVDIDEQIIKLGKKHFWTDKILGLKIVNSDAIEFIKRDKEKYDLIFVDLYYGEKVDKGSEGNDFMEKLKSSLTSSGVVIFNRINFKKFKNQNIKFQKSLQVIFPIVSAKKIYSNLIFYCQ